MADCAHKLCQEFGWFSGGAGIVIGAVPVESGPGARDKFGLGNEQLFDAQIMSGHIAVQVERTALSTAIKGLKNVNLALYGGRMRPACRRSRRLCPAATYADTRRSRHLPPS